jgi:hypothetical protein
VHGAFRRRGRKLPNRGREANRSTTGGPLPSSRCPRPHVSVVPDGADGLAVGKVFTAPLDVLFAEGDYLNPDIVFVRADRVNLIGDRGVEGPPDLVVEVLSPSTEARDRGVKLGRYRLYGVPEYWVVDPAYM